MGGSWSSQVKEVNPVLPDLGNDELSWKEHPKFVQLVGKLRQESPNIRKLNDRQMGIILITAQSCSDKDSDCRRLAEITIVIGQAESSARNISTEHPQSSEIGVFQQNELFGQRDNKHFWTEKLSKETRLNIKDCNDRSYRILNKEQKGDSDWRYGKIEEVCYKLQRCPAADKAIYSNPERIEVAIKVSGELYPNQSSMLSNSSPKSQRPTNRQDSRTFGGGPDVQIRQPYTGPIDPHSVVDAFKARGMDSSFENRARVGEQLGIQGTAGSAEFNTKLLHELGQER